MSKKILVILGHPDSESFCGIKVKRISEFSPIKGSSMEKREKWLKMAEVLGNKA